MQDKRATITLNNGLYKQILTLAHKEEIPVNKTPKERDGADMASTDKCIIRDPIIYHINDPEFRMGGKSKIGLDDARYHEHPRLWGNVVTNKARGKRKDNEFATYIAPDGTRLNHISYQSFKQLFCRGLYKHEYISMASVTPEIQVIANNAPFLGHAQVAKLIKALQGNRHYREMKFGCQL